MSKPASKHKLAEFPSVIAAVNSAVSIQTELHEGNQDVPEDNQVKIRIGINLGEVLEDTCFYCDRT